MHTISFMTANFVAREVDYHMPEGWGQGDTAAQHWFKPLNTFEERFSAMLGEIAELGFTAVDLWVAHLHWSWATPEHLEITARCLAKHKLKPVSYAGSYGATPAEVRATCALCVRLGIPLLSGGSKLFQQDRETFVSIIREHGLIFCLENHPEKNPDELLAKLGEGDEDVVGVAVDTGWFGTRGYDALEAIRALAPRLKHIHLKDVKAPREEKTGFGLIDMGHETCGLGEGIVPVEAIAGELVKIDYRGPVSIEHEPEDFDPREDCAKSKGKLFGWLQSGIEAIRPKDPVGVAIVGCGNIADRYAGQINDYPHVKLLGGFDLERDRAEALVRDFGGKVYDSLEAVLADPAVEIVVNLTIHHAHVEVITKCLEAGKHVHSEKPLAFTHEEARGLVALAESKHLRLSCAPTTWLGEAQQTAWRAIRDGRIGTPRVAYAEANWGRIEAWHPNPGPFYDVGVIFDVAVYPLTLLTAWFGPAKRVIAGGGVVYPERQTKDGTPFSITTPDWNNAVIDLSAGVKARITASFYTGWNTRQHGLEVHGDDAMIALDRWDAFNSPIYFAEFANPNKPRRIVPVRPPFQGTEFASGLSDLAAALRENRPHRTPGSHAAHVVEIAEAIHTSVKTGQAVDVTSSFPESIPCDWASST